MLKNILPVFAADAGTGAVGSTATDPSNTPPSPSVLSNTTPDGLVTDFEEAVSDFMAWVKAEFGKDPDGAKAAMAALISDAEEIGIDAIKSAILDIAAFKAANPTSSIGAILKAAGSAIGGLISKL